MQYRLNKHTLEITLDGDYLGFDNEQVQEKIQSTLMQPQLSALSFDASTLKEWDSTLPALLLAFIKRAKARNLKIDFQNFPHNLTTLLELAQAVDRKPENKKQTSLPFVESVGEWGVSIATAVKKGSHFIKETTLSVLRFLSRSAVMRKIDFLFALEDCSYRAIGIVSLVSFMVGLILAFVGAIQLKAFGAQIYVASLVAIGMTRIMGAIMVGIIMAGRTGASYAATIGTMQVNEEIDALKTFGIPVQDFLVLPRIMALTITIPILTILADFMGILGGAAVGVGMLGISAPEYWTYSVEALDMINFMVGLFHALVFGIIISLCGCYYGIYCGRNADSVGKATTQAVVSAIVWMIVATGIITLIFEVLGI